MRRRRRQVRSILSFGRRTVQQKVRNHPVRMLHREPPPLSLGGNVLALGAHSQEDGTRSVSIQRKNRRSFPSDFCGREGVQRETRQAPARMRNEPRGQPRLPESLSEAEVRGGEKRSMLIAGAVRRGRPRSDTERPEAEEAPAFTRHVREGAGDVARHAPLRLNTEVYGPGVFLLSDRLLRSGTTDPQPA